ncbi:hypothetical protein CWE07_06840 [Aliidiomarina maris]|uniref:Uncharacterized protein n=1 Tax=Aliidiomarina maris TaxID=531312 RepID=A0ABY0BRR2_9GAMM|nr:hypothetical protein CWE07_06840 [Aliidiomarina maris]
MGAALVPTAPNTLATSALWRSDSWACTSPRLASTLATGDAIEAGQCVAQSMAARAKLKR